jgi:cation diffusion facilitator CzcD-associated flavoprotein CzcO
MLSRFVSEAELEFLSFAIVNFRRFPIIVRTIQTLVRSWMRRQLRDADTAARLMPAYGLGCKRPTPSNTYLQAFNRDNVRLVTQPIERVTARSIVTKDGSRHDADALILATGFLTTERGNAPSFDVVNGYGVELGQFWEEHRRQAYAGVSVAGFPNLFLTAGPYSGGFNWFTMLDAHLAHIIACMDKARARGATRVEVGREAHDSYMRRMWSRADGTVFKDAACATANSYYIDRFGDASLPIPQTPWWRVAHNRWVGTRDYYFSTAIATSACEEPVVGETA